MGNDMLNDIWAAGRQGMRTVFFAGDPSQSLLRRDEVRCQNLKPDAVITQLTHLSEWLIH